MRRMSTCSWRCEPRRSTPWRREPPAQLRDDAVHRREVGGRPARQRAVEVAERPRRRQRLRALDLRALELAAQHRLEAAQGVARQPVVARVVGRAARGCGSLRRPSARRIRCTSMPTTPEPSAGASERGQREAREVAQAPLVAVGERLGDLRAQLVEVDLLATPLVAARAGARLDDPGLDRRGLGRRGRRSARRRGRRRGGPRATSPASPRAPAGRSRARASRSRRARRTASSSSEVPIATPSRRSSSPSSSSCASMLTRARGRRARRRARCRCGA